MIELPWTIVEVLQGFTETNTNTLIVLTIALMVLLVGSVLSRKLRQQEIRNRTFALNNALTETEADIDKITDRRSLHGRTISEISDLLYTAENAIGSGDTIHHLSSARRGLVKAGIFSPYAPVWLLTGRVGLAIGLPSLFLMVIQILNPELDLFTSVLLLLSLTILGSIIPGFYLDFRSRELKKQCERGLPDLMDLIVICVQSGLSLRAAIDRVSKEIAHNYPYLGVHLYILTLQIRAGRSLEEALVNMKQRLGISEFGNLGGYLKQSEELGSSISEALNIFSEELRDRRLFKAEERAHALPVKLTLPLALFVFPVLIVVIALPLIIKVRNGLG